MPNFFDVIVILLIYVQFGAIWKPEYGDMIYNLLVFILNTLLFNKNWKQSKEIIVIALITKLTRADTERDIFWN